MFPSSEGYVPIKNALETFMKNNPYLCDSDYTYFKAKDNFIITPLSLYNRRI